MMSELSEAFTAFDLNDELWVAVLAFAGEHTTAGLDMPKFFGPNRERRDNPPDDIDPFALRRRTMKPVVAAVQGLCLTIGIEMMLAADIVIAADSARFCQMESRRGSDGRLNSDSSSCSWGPGPNKRGDRRRRRTVGRIECGGIATGARSEEAGIGLLALLRRPIH